MRPHYQFTLTWANQLLANMFSHVSAVMPELRASWPLRPWGGFEAQTFTLNGSFALLIIRGNADQMPSSRNNQPEPLPATNKGCPIGAKLDVAAIFTWARKSFYLKPFDSVFVVPMIEAPRGEKEFNAQPEEIQRLIIMTTNYECERIAGVLKGFAQKLAPPPLSVQATTVQVIQGDFVTGDKVQGDKIVNDASQNVKTTVNNSAGASVNMTATNKGAINADTAKVIEQIQELAVAIQKSNLGSFEKDDVKAWIEDSIAELKKPEADRKAGKIEYTWGKIVGVLKGAKEVYDSVSAILGPIIPIVAPMIASKL